MITKSKEQLRHNITYTQAGVSCFVVQESANFEVLCLVETVHLSVSANFGTNEEKTYS